MTRLTAFVFLSALLLGLSGCASTGGNPADPWESVNRKIFVVNDKLDTYALKPAAQGYKAAVPLPARVNVSNFFGNIEDVWTGFNNLLQGKPADGFSDFGRVLINSSLGILGFFDIASEMGIDKHEEDFGQTLGRWGMGSGPYVMLPLMGPSNLRDGAGRIPDMLANPLSKVPNVPIRNSLTGTRIINERSQLLGADSALDEAALDKYNYLRDFYLKRRRSLVFDGNPPREKEDF